VIASIDTKRRNQARRPRSRATGTPKRLHASASGLARWPSQGLRHLVDVVGGGAAGWIVFAVLAASYAAMAVGLHSRIAVAACFAGSVLQTGWNWLPLSAAHQVMTVTLFCLVWADTGRLWSVDALRARRPVSEPLPLQPVWPLDLIRCQIAAIYGASGLWKLFGPTWRDGSAVHYALNLDIFNRFPGEIPPSAAWILMGATYGVLAWELAFPVLVCFRRTRRFTLAAGVALHLGLWATLELGTFSWIMIASYVAFLDPAWVARNTDGWTHLRLARSSASPRSAIPD
jgi:hypothetical protein